MGRDQDQTYVAANGKVITPRYANYMLALLAIVLLVHNVDRQIMSILLVPIQKDLHVSDTAMGLLTGFAFTVVYIGAGIPIAHVCDRANRTKILTLAIVCWSVCTALCGAAGNFAQLALARVGVGLGEASGNPACASLIGDLFPRSKRGAAMGVFYLGSASGAFVGMFLGGVITDTFGWRMAFVVVGLPGLILALIVWLTMTEPARGGGDGAQAATQTPAPSFLESQRYLWSLPTYRWIVAGNAVRSVALYAGFAWFPAFLIRAHHMTTSKVGFWSGIATGAGMGLGNLLMGSVADRMGKRHVGWYMGMGSLTNFAALPLIVVFMLSGSIPLVLLSYMFGMGMVGSSSAAVAALTQDIVRPNMRSMSFSTQYMVTSLVGMGGGPLLVGVLNDWLKPEYGSDAVRYSLLIVLIPLVLLTAIAFARAARTTSRDLEKVHGPGAVAA